jgi:8-oxo-dGTP pyrophosphatase MutT (NUDIX family)
MNHADQHFLLDNPRKLIGHLESRLDGQGLAADWTGADTGGIQGAAVLFLLTQCRTKQSPKPEICLLLTKRSRRVVQPGDLCCPGGGIAPGDRILSRILPLPVRPLRRWPRWLKWQAKHRTAALRVMQAWTAGLRESWEETRLNPLRVSLLGPLPVQQLIMFERRIFPLAAWVPYDLHLRPNHEVARIVRLPLRYLLDPGNYGRYRLSISSGSTPVGRQSEFPCFMHHERQGTEVLWGATYRITMDFLRIAFGFSSPVMDGLPVVHGRRDTSYFNGSVWDPASVRNTELRRP